MPLDAFTQTTRTVRGTKPTVHTSRDRPYSTVFFHMKVLNNRRVGVSVFRGAAVTREREREKERKCSLLLNIMKHIVLFNKNYARKFCNSEEQRGINNQLYNNRKQ